MRPTVSETLTEWRAVPGYEGFYEVSDGGSVRGLTRQVANRTVRGRNLKPIINRGGYARVALQGIGKPVYRSIHALVLEAFVGPRPEGAVTRHLDGDRLNNCVENLAWGTATENQYDTVSHGNNRNAAMERCKRGHLLVEGNLRRFKSHGKIRHRICAACYWGRDTARNRGMQGDEASVQSYSDMKYREMGLE